MTRRRSPGEGNIRKRANGTWEARLMVHGRSHSFYAATKTEALHRMREARATADAGLPQPNRTVTVGKYLNDWIAAKVEKEELRPSTRASYESYARNHIIPHLGHVKLAELSVDQVDSLFRKCRRDGLSLRSIGHIRAILRAALRTAVRQKKILVNVVTDTDAIKVPKSLPKVLEPEEAAILIRHVAEEKNGAAYVIGLTCGLRIGEVLGLRWADIDFEEATLRVEQQYQRVAGLSRFSEPKTSAGTRKVPLPEVAADALRVQRDRQSFERKRTLEKKRPWRDDLDLVFTGRRGLPMNPSSTGRRLHEILAEAGLPDVTFHSLRHSAVSIILANGVPINVVSAAIGHSKTSVTWDVYSHVLKTQSRLTADAMNSALKAETSVETG